MGRWWNRILLLAILGLTALSVITVWPSEPDRYLPNAIPWPEGKGIKLKLPAVEGGTFVLRTVERRAMSLGLDLRGGTRLVLEPEPGFQVENLDDALDGAVRIIERRVNEFGVAESEVNILSGSRVSVQLPGIDPEEAISKIGRTALLQFCEPVTDAAGQVATLPSGATVTYEPQTCEPVRDEQGSIIVQGGALEFVPWGASETQQSFSNPGPERIIWQPAAAEIDGVKQELTGRLLRPNTSVFLQPIINTPVLQFEWTAEGAKVSEAVTGRMETLNYPLAPFLDGQPVLDSNGLPIAPNVIATITDSGVITGLTLDEAQDLSKLLNTGAFPVPLRVIQQQDVDATLGDTAVRNSVIAGEIALLLIMAFMILYYRLP
ncbi:MAG: hypothetical protein HY723_05175, partial [Chloroflexi bacterium]|nr:hypothetical protein [Chloroflexota bacterium]